jgi:NADPH:quinone reductase-like Zn-dependent oxidoreductase
MAPPDDRRDTVAMDTMRAAVFHENGGPEVIRVEDVPRPDPGPGEVRLRVRAAALNHLDLWVRRGLPIETTMPHIGGSDIAGEVESVGPGVDAALVGTRVVVDPSLGYDFYDGTDRGAALRDAPLRLIGEHTDGGFADFVVVPEANLLQLPDSVSFEAAAAASLAAVTAWRATLVRGGLQPGESVLVTGGSGGVATLAVQYAARAGARVHAVTSGAANVERLRALGAHHVYDRTSDAPWARAVKGDTGGRGVDLVVDSVGEAIWDSMMRCLAVGGRLVSYGATAGPVATLDLRHVFWKQLTVMGSTMGTPAEYRRAMGLVFAGDVAAPVHAVLGLDEVRRGHELLEAGGVFGKIVIVPAGSGPPA